MADIELVIKLDEETYNDIKRGKIYSSYRDVPQESVLAIANGTPLSKIVDSLKELSKDHRHNYISNSHEGRAWRLGVEDSIDLILTETGDKE